MNKLGHVQPMKRNPSVPIINDNWSERSSCSQVAPKALARCSQLWVSCDKHTL